jgi:formylglycine-generating enzyme required for sulfatase activity
MTRANLAILTSLAGVALLFVSAAPYTGFTPDLEPRLEPSTHKSYTETISASKVRFDMVAIPGGTFLMGSPERERGRGADEGPLHPVMVRPFWMGKTEVTWDEYDLYFKPDKAAKKEKRTPAEQAADAVSKPSPPYPDETRGYGHDGYPAIGISHHAAMEYCRWLSAKTGKAYRLPTEAEWEFACRAGTATAYHFGADSAKLGEYAWFEGNSNESTQPVGRKKANPFGLHDMHGNVAEWCLDHYKPGHYTTFPLNRLTLAPVLLPTADRYSHVARGGSWADAAAQCRSAARRGSDKSWNKMDPAEPQSIWWVWDADFVGFRVVRALEEQDALKGIKSKITRESK